MPLREDLYDPISGACATGVDLRYSPVYDKIKEARRREDELDQGAWKRERKVADHSLVIKLVQEAIATQSKDLQLAAWMAEALLQKEGIAGLEQGLMCCRELTSRFGGSLFPSGENGDLELLAAPLDWLGSCLDIPVKMAALTAEGHSWFRFKESRVVGYEDQAKDAAQKKAREKAIKDGRLPPEEFDKAFANTPKAFYASLGRNLDGALAVIHQLDGECAAVFANEAPSFGKLSGALEEVRHEVRQLLEKKRLTDPDPVEPMAPEPAASSIEPTAVASSPPAQLQTMSFDGRVEPTDRRAAVESIVAAAAYLRKLEPYNPAPYLMLRGLRWGELRNPAELCAASLLEAPPTEARRQIKLLALEQRWGELLETAETLMAQPYARGWLDLQRFVVEACVESGPQFDAIAKAIRSQLRALLRDIPELLTATLMDDTPAANLQTQSWLRDLLAEPSDEAAAVTPPVNDPRINGYRRRFVDAYSLATTAMRAGDHSKALQVMREEIDRQPSGRGRFFRRLQLVQLCIAAKKEAMAQPLLEDLIVAAEAHKIDEWEDREAVADALLTLMSASKRIQADAKEKQKYFERICRLDPVKALTAGT